MALWDSIIDGTTAQIAPPVELEIEEYCRISITDDQLPIHVVVPGGESRGYGTADYVVAANFNFQVTGGTLIPPSGSDPDFKWGYSVDGGSVDDGIIFGGTVTLIASANEPSEETHTTVVAVQIFNIDPNDSIPDFNTQPGNYKARTLTGGSLTLTVSARP